MWADTFVIRVGEGRNTLVAIQTDAPETLAGLRRLFADWLDDSMIPELGHRPPPFVINLGHGHSETGARMVPHVRNGSLVLARSRDPQAIVHALSRVIGGVHARRPDARSTRLGLRAFVLGENVVLTDAAPPHLVADRTLADDGIEEIVGWDVEVTPPGRVRFSPPLPGMRWAETPWTPPAELGEHRLVGIVVRHDEPMTPAKYVTDLAIFNGDRRWFQVLGELAASGRITGGSDRAALREGVRQLLGASPSATNL